MLMFYSINNLFFEEIKYPVASYGVFSCMISLMQTKFALTTKGGEFTFLPLWNPPSCKVPQQAAGYERINFFVAGIIDLHVDTVGVPLVGTRCLEMISGLAC